MHLSPLKDAPKGESQPVPSSAAVKLDILPPPEGAVKTQNTEAETSKRMKNNLTEEKDMEVMDAHEEGTPTEGKFRHIEFSSTLNVFSYQTKGKISCHRFKSNLDCVIEALIHILLY